MKSFNYIKIIGLHVLIGLAIYLSPVFSKVYLLAIFVYFTNTILKARQQEKALQVLIACGYVVGAEVFLRMTGGNFLYETSKYLVILFSIIGFVTIGFGKQPIPYILYIFLLIPGILIAGFNITEQTTIRTAITFNLSGPVCLGIVAMFCYKRKVAYQDFHRIFLSIGLPLIAATTYLFLFTPDLREIITGTGSNYAASGGFGPNQVSTVLGLGMFVFSIRFFMLSPSLFLKIINGLLLGVLSYRAVVTFSRGGVITALFMIIVFVYFYFKKVNIKSKVRITKLVFTFAGIGMCIWLYSSLQTNGLIERRYANEDALGREKADISTGRTDLVFFELAEFFNNPILGVGVGKIKELRKQKEGVEAASHNEISRILSEHGLIGLVAFLILLMTPLSLRFKNKSNIFFYSCYIFWFLTINHSSMRIAAPAFIYGLSLLHVNYNLKTKKRIERFRNKTHLTE
ncbi:O-antigen ligase family protein [Flavivirga abyssicola]|uniref:O-antigen ligase family protein n=1 Tax=Flavivirga abyssicola TaxID=3063533 RepID=UPI0026DFE91D|nr:O-antigen ligase family protein [Flavivirga sp. MEBiC07777]WVK13622.1 O-antigen ligase family protein [Flavivirga sp. MEBiC07777]